MHRLARDQPLGRRAFLLASATTAGLAVAGCGLEAAKPGKTASATGGPAQRWARHRYAHHSDVQFGQLGLPRGRGPVAGTIVMIHGGGWTGPSYATSLLPLATAMRSRGFAVWYLSYRGSADGGDYPAVFRDIAAGCDHLATLADSDGLRERELMGKVIALGHSAGGHLATWAASRRGDTPGGAPAYAFDQVCSLAGPLCFTRAASVETLASTVRRLMGGTPKQFPRRYRLADPLALVPAASSVVAFHGTSDTVVPIALSQKYVAAAKAAGGTAAFIPVQGATHGGILQWATSAIPKVIQPIDGAGSAASR